MDINLTKNNKTIKRVGINEFNLVIEQVRECFNNPVVEYHQRLVNYKPKQSYRLYDEVYVFGFARKSELQSLLISHLENYKGYQAEDKMTVFEKFVPMPKDYDEKLIKLSLKFKEINKTKNDLLDKLIEDLHVSVKNYGKPLDLIKKVYKKHLEIYPKKYLIKALHIDLYSEFPTIKEIEEYIRDNNGIRGKFFYDMNRVDQTIDEEEEDDF